MKPNWIAGLGAAAAWTASAMTGATAAQRPFTLDLGHAYVGWEIQHFEYSKTVGRFDKFDGEFLIDEENPEKSSVRFVIDAASINSNHAGRDNHLRAADYLNVAAHPEIRFVSTKIDMADEASGVITGDLTFRGVTKPFSMRFRMTADAPFASFLPRYDELRAVGFEAEGELDRVAHGFDILNVPGGPLGPVIKLDVHFDLVDCAAASPENIPCNYGRNTDLSYPYE